MDRIRELIRTLALSIISSIVLMLLTWYWELLTPRLAVVIAIPFVAIVTIIYVLKSYSRIGIASWSKSRSTSKNFRNILTRAESSVDFLVAWGGGSIPGAISTGYWEDQLTAMAEKGVSIRILLIKPGSYAEEKRLSDKPKWIPGENEIFIRALLSIKNGRIGSAYRSNLNIKLYSVEAIWAMCFVDNKLASIGFYGKGNGRDLPSIELKRIKDKQTFFDAHKNQYEAIWREASPLHTTDEFESILAQINK